MARKIQKILVTSKRDTSDLNDMITFISLYDNPVNFSQHILQCGSIEELAKLLSQPTQL